MRQRLLPVLLMVAAAALAGCGDDGGDDTAKDTGSSATSGSSPATDVTCDYPADPQIPAAKDVEPPPSAPTVGGQVEATMETSLGDFQLTLDADKAPCTVNSFVSLAEQNYYNDTPCHRLTTLAESGIAVLQCGDPSGTGSGGPGYTYDDEVDGSETYGPGTLAMANRGADTNGSQFFIVFDDSPLPASYTVFGHVDDATVSLLQDLASEGVDTQSNGTTTPKKDVGIDSVTFHD